MSLFDTGKQIVLAAPQLYIDVDVETDGWAGHGSMLSLGAVAPDGETFYSEIKPLFTDYVLHQREFCETHGLQRSRLIEEAPAHDEVMARLASWVGDQSRRSSKPTVFAAFNAGFDFGFVQLYFLKAGIENPFGAAPFDLKSLALAVRSDWDWSLTSKGRLPAELLPDGDFTHHALEDAVYQQKLHFAFAGMIAEGVNGTAAQTVKRPSA